jgi:diguanylate cyclase (GGDEF)-like protein
VFAVFLFFGVLTELLSIPMPQSGYQSLGPMATLPAILVLGPAYAAPIAAIGVGLSGIRLRRPGVTTVFNAGQRMLAVLWAGVTWNTIESGRPSLFLPASAGRSDLMLPAVVGSIIAYVVTTHILVSAFSAARREQPFLPVLIGNAIIRFAVTAALGMSGLIIAMMFLGYPIDLAGVYYVLIPGIVAAIALLLHTSRRQSTRQLVGVHEAMADLLQTLDLERLLDRLADRVQQITKPDMLWITLRSSDDTSEVVVARGIDLKESRTAALALSCEASEPAVADDRPRRITDYERDPRQAPGSPAAFPPGLVRSVILVPLVAGTERVGTLAATKPIVEYFTEAQERAVAMLTAQAALVVNNARLYQGAQRNLARVEALTVQNAELLKEAERKAHQLALVNRAATRVASSLKPSEIFETMVEELHTTLNYACAVVRIREGDQLVLMARRGYSAISNMFPITQGVVGRVARTAKPELITDVSRDPDYVMTHPGVTQEACAPMISHGEVVGIISIEVIEPTLTPADLDLLITLAGSAAVALEKAHLYEQTHALASTDGLTGLLNYRAFWEALERELERSMRYGVPFSLIMIEIDKFKRYNDTFGHLRGDEVLRLVARVLRQEHRAQVDIVARYGGDEFIILLPHTSKGAAAETAERIRAALEATPLISDLKIASVTLSLGVASFPDDGKSADALVEAADRSMYSAKKRGGNAVATANSP